MRWSVDGRPRQRTFSTKRLAELFRSELQVAARAAVPFSPQTGLPVQQTRRSDDGATWYSLACEFADHKWPRVSPRHRKGLAEALTALTMALFDERPRPASTAPAEDAVHLVVQHAGASRARARRGGRRC